MSFTPFDLNSNLISRLSLERLPEERRIELVNKAAELVEKRVIVRLIESLSPADLDEAKMLARDPQALFEFLNAKNGNIAALFDEEIDSVRDALAANTKNI